MNHFNFFEDAQKEKKTLNVPAVSAAILVCTAVVMIGAFLVMKIKLTEVQKQLSYLESVEENADFRKQYEKVKELDKNTLNAEADYIFLKTADTWIEKSTTVSDKLITKLMSYFPSGTKVIRISVSQHDITVEGTAKSLSSMITAEKNLNSSSDYSYVFINYAKEDGHEEENGKDAVTFTCKLVIAQKGNG